MTSEGAKLTPPVAKKVATERVHHGHTFVDEYEWLRAKEDAEVVAYLESENAYTEQQTAHLAPLRDQIFQEIKSRTQETDMSVPTRMGDWWYYARTIEGKQYGVQCRAPIAARRLDPPELAPGVELPGEQVLLDGNAEAEGHDFFSVGAFSLSHDGTLLAYSVDVVGDERYTLRFKNLETGELLPDEIPDTAPGVTWAIDHSHVFYLTVDDSWRPDTVWRHKLGTDRAQDVTVFHEPDERFWVSVGSTRSEKYLVIWVGSKITSEGWVLESENPEGEFRVVLPRREGVEYGVEHAVVAGEDRFLIMHNDVVDGEKAENFVLAEAPVSDPTSLTILIPHRSDVRLEEVDAFADHLVLGYRREALTRLAIWPLGEGGYGEFTEIAFDEELFSVGLGANPEWRQRHCGWRSRRSSRPVRSTTTCCRRVNSRCASRNPCSAISTPATTSSNATGPSPRTGRASRSRSSGGRRTAPTTPPPRSSMGTARTRPAWIPRSRSPGCRCSIAAWCSWSRTCAAAARWAGTGTRPARRSRRRTPSPISSRAHGI